MVWGLPNAKSRGANSFGVLELVYASVKPDFCPLIFCLSTWSGSTTLLHPCHSWSVRQTRQGYSCWILCFSYWACSSSTRWKSVHWWLSWRTSARIRLIRMLEIIEIGLFSTNLLLSETRVLSEAFYKTKPFKRMLLIKIRALPFALQSDKTIHKLLICWY